MDQENLIPKNAFFKFAKRRIELFKSFEKEKHYSGLDSFSTEFMGYNSKIGSLGEAIAIEYLIQNKYDVYRAEINFFDNENYNNIILPKYFLLRSEIKKYQELDKNIGQYYLLVGNDERIKDSYKIKESKNTRDNFWNRYPGRLDFVAEKGGIIYFFDAKVNTSQLGDWQRIRMLWLCKNNIPAMIIRIKLNFSQIDGQRGNKDVNMIVRVPFKKNFAFGNIKKTNFEIKSGKRFYSIQLPESKEMIVSTFPSNKVEKVCYEIAFEEAKESIDLRIID